MFALRTLLSKFKLISHQVYCYKHARNSHSTIHEFNEIFKSNYFQKYFDDFGKRGIDETFNQHEKFCLQQLIEQRKEVLEGLKSLNELEKGAKEGDDFLAMINVERNELNAQLSEIEFKLVDVLAPRHPNSNEIILEISAGIGGQEAMLFANELHEMYLGYASYKNWNIKHQEYEKSDLGGIRHSAIFLEGLNVLNYMRHESGIHRVQRIPVTEKGGRIHTSTVSVAILPTPSDINIKLHDRDLVIETKRSSGAGGQHVNKTESAVRITHLPTGVVVESQTDRSQIKNREIARQKLVARLYDMQQKEMSSSIHISRKIQVGTSARSDKVRTYNYPQDRITDHRINRSFHNLIGFLSGESLLDNLVTELILFSDRERFNLFASSISGSYKTVS